jgi:hypothetical protein
MRSWQPANLPMVDEPRLKTVQIALCAEHLAASQKIEHAWAG